MVNQDHKLTAFIINPAAGNGKCGKLWSLLHNQIKEWYPHEVIMTTKRGEAETSAQDAVLRGIERIFVVGGDGTINEVVNGVGDANVEIGVIPLGTGNDLAKTLGIPRKMNDLIKMVENPGVLHQSEVNVAKINGRLFIIACGFGFDGLVAKKANESRMIKKMGSLGYLISALMTLRSFSPLDIQLTVDDNTYTIDNGWLLAVGNAPYYGGGMKICPNASMSDDILELCVVSKLTKIKLLRFMPKVYTGKHVHLDQYVSFFRGKKISIHSNGHAVSHADGELIDSTHLEIELCDYRMKWLTTS